MKEIRVNEITLRYEIGDCLELMKDIPDGSVNLILCDLPYGTTHNGWDIIIPFNKLWELYEKIVKDNGVIGLFGQGMFTAELMMSNKQMWKYNLIWEKDRPSGFLNANKMPLRNHEDICVFYDKLPVYNPQKWPGEPQHSRGKKYKEQKNRNYGKFEQQDKGTGNTEKMPRSVLKFKRPHPPIFPTEKPLKLCEWLIKTYTNPNELVLDNCLGSGTTLEACRNTNRNGIGFEINPDYEPIIRKRIMADIKPVEGYKPIENYEESVLNG